MGLWIPGFRFFRIPVSNSSINRMPPTTTQLPDAKAAYKRTLETFIGVYCRKKHGTKGPLCPECTGLRDYAFARTDHCPQHPKPACKNCTIHCYSPAYRQRIRDVMKFSGMHFILRGRLDWLLKYFLSR